MSQGARAVYTFPPYIHTTTTTTTKKEAKCKTKRPILNANIFYSDTNEIINICRNIIYDPRLEFGRFLGCRQAQIISQAAQHIHIYLLISSCAKKKKEIHISYMKKEQCLASLFHKFVVVVARREIHERIPRIWFTVHCAISIVNLSI